MSSTMLSANYNCQYVASEDDKVKFLQEAAIMAQFKHHNVVTMYGVIKDGEPVSLK